jgi:hypothetical protein
MIFSAGSFIHLRLSQLNKVTESIKKFFHEKLLIAALPGLLYNGLTTIHEKLWDEISGLQKCTSLNAANFGVAVGSTELSPHCQG